MSNYNFVLINQTTNMDENLMDGYEFYAVDCSNGNITLTLPTITYNGVFYIIHRVDSSNNTLTIAAQNGQTIREVQSLTLAPNRRAEIVSHNSDWLYPL